MWGCGAQSGTFYRKIPHFLLGGIGKSHTHKFTLYLPSRRCTTLPTAALPSLSKATSAMDPNRGATAPYESIAGGQCPGSRSLRPIPLFGAPKWHPWIN